MWLVLPPNFYFKIMHYQQFKSYRDFTATGTTQGLAALCRKQFTIDERNIQVELQIGESISNAFSNISNIASTVSNIPPSVLGDLPQLIDGLKQVVNSLDAETIKTTVEMMKSFKTFRDWIVSFFDNPFFVAVKIACEKVIDTLKSLVSAYKNYFPWKTFFFAVVASTCLKESGQLTLAGIFNLLAVLYIQYRFVVGMFNTLHPEIYGSEERMLANFENDIIDAFTYAGKNFYKIILQVYEYFVKLPNDNPASSVGQLQNADSGFLCKTTATIMWLFITGTKRVNINWSTAVVDHLKSYSQVVKGIEDYYSYFSRLMELIYNNTLQPVLGGEPLVLSWNRSLDVAQLLSQCLKIEYEFNTRTLPENCFTKQRLTRLHQDYVNARMRVSEARRHDRSAALAQEYVDVERCGTILRNVENHIAAVVPDAPKMRQEPVGILIVSEPGIGKSRLVDYLVSDLTAITLSEDHFEDFLKHPNNYVYNRGGEKYYDGFHANTVCLVFDDFLQQREVVGGDCAESAEVIKNINVAAHKLNIAKLEGKSNTYAMNTFTLMTSNVSKPEEFAHAIHDREALKRRFHFRIVPSVDVDYASKNPTPSRRFDIKKLPRDPETKATFLPRSLWRFNVWTSDMKDDDFPLSMNYDELIEELIKAWLLRRAHSEASASYSSSKSAVYRGRYRDRVFPQPEIVLGNIGELQVARPAPVTVTGSVGVTVANRCFEDIEFQLQATFRSGRFPNYFPNNPKDAETILGKYKSVRPLRYIPSEPLWDMRRTFSSTLLEYYADLKRNVGMNSASEIWALGDMQCGAQAIRNLEREFRNVMMYIPPRNGRARDRLASLHDMADDKVIHMNDGHYTLREALLLAFDAGPRQFRHAAELILDRFRLHCVADEAYTEDYTAALALADRYKSMIAAVDTFKKAVYDVIQARPYMTSLIAVMAGVSVVATSVFATLRSSGVSLFSLQQTSGGMGNEPNFEREAPEQYDYQSQYKQDKTSANAAEKLIRARAKAFRPAPLPKHVGNTQMNFFSGEHPADARSNILARVRKNMYLLYLCTDANADTGKFVGAVLFTKGTYCTFNSHFFPTMNDYCTSNPNAVLRLFASNNYPIVGMRDNISAAAVPLSDFLDCVSTSLARYCVNSTLADKDVYLVDLKDVLIGFPFAKDISKHFVAHETISGRTFPVTLIAGSEFTSYHASNATFPSYPLPLPTVGEIANHDMIEYRASTVAGDCGGVLVCELANRGMYKICGIHMARVSSRDVGVSQYVNFEMLQSWYQILEHVSPDDVYRSEVAQMQHGETQQGSEQETNLFSDIPGLNNDDSVEIETMFQLDDDVEEVLPHDVLIDDMPTWLKEFRFIKHVDGVNDLGRSSIENTGVILPGYRSKKRPPHLRPFVDKSTGQLVDPFEVSISKYALKHRALPVSILHFCAEATFNMLKSNSPVICDRRVFTFVEAVAGSEHIPDWSGIDRTTSAGYPYVTEMKAVKPFKGRQHILGTEGDYDFSSKEALQLKIDVEKIVNDARKGRRNQHVFIDRLKDSLISIEKAKMGKGRLFSSCPLPLLVATRMYFGAFCNWMVRNSVSNGCVLAFNPYGRGWDRIAGKLRSKLSSYDDNGVSAGDFKSYDASEHPIVHYIILAFINDWYGKSPDHPDTIARTVLFAEVVNSRHLCKGVLYEWAGSLPSGHPLTAVINNIYNQIAARYAWYRMKDDETEYVDAFNVSDVNLMDLHDFERHVTYITCGDDNIFSVTQCTRSRYNLPVMAMYMSELGLELTSEIKDRELSIDFRPLREVQFLKRSFYWDAKRVKWLAPLDLPSFLDTIYWYRKSPHKTKQQSLFDNCENALLELAQYPPEWYENWSTAIAKVCFDTMGKPPRFNTRDMWLDVVDDKK